MSLTGRITKVVAAGTLLLYVAHLTACGSSTPESERTHVPPSVGPSTTVATTSSTAPPPPSCPDSSDEAARDLGTDDATAHLVSAAAGCGWHTDQLVTLILFPGACVDYSDDKLSGATLWTDRGVDHNRGYLSGRGSVVGPATVYWTTSCLHLK